MINTHIYAPKLVLINVNIIKTPNIIIHTVVYKYQKPHKLVNNGSYSTAVPYTRDHAWSFTPFLNRKPHLYGTLTVHR